jgi:hypothetical protein
MDCKTTTFLLLLLLFLLYRTLLYFWSKTPSSGGIWRILYASAQNQDWSCYMSSVYKQILLPREIWHSNNGDYASCRTAGCDAVYSETNLLIFRKNLLPPTSTLKWKVTSSSETAINFYQITRRHIPEDNDLYVLIYSRGYDFHDSNAVVTGHLNEMHKMTSQHWSRFPSFFVSFLLSSVRFSSSPKLLNEFI